MRTSLLATPSLLNRHAILSAILLSIALPVREATAQTMALSTTSLTFASTPASPNPVTQVVTISNTGSSTLTGLDVGAVTYGAGQPSGWLGAGGITTSLSPGSSYNQSISVSPGSLREGTYTATYPITNANGSNRLATVSVTFVVAGPTMSLSSATLGFASTPASPNPVSQTMTITNTGSSTMTGLNVGAVIYGAGQPTGWLNAGGITTSLAPGGSYNQSVSVTAGSLRAGTYTAKYAITNANATNPVDTVFVSFNVAGPTVALSASTLAFSSTSVSPNPVSQTITVTNEGSSTVTGLDVGAVTYAAGQPTGWLSAGAVTTSLVAGGSYNQSVSVTAGSLKAGTYTATYPITNANATNPTVTVTVTFTVAGPTIALSTQSLTFASTPASPNPVAQTVGVSNVGSSTMTGLDAGAVTYGAGQPTGWLSVGGVTTSLSAGGLYNQSVSVTTGSLRAGTYTATYPISSANSTNPAVTVSVTFTVAGPTLALSTPSLSFASTSASPNPVSQTVTITNSGSSTLTGLNIGAVTYGAGQPTGWLSPGAVTTSLSAGGSYNQSVSVTTGSLRAGTYSARYLITNANAAIPSDTVVVSFTVAGPTIALSTTTLAFASTPVSPNPVSQTVTITNEGSSTITGLDVSAISYGAGQPTGWLSAGGITSSLAASSSYNQSVSVSSGSLRAGTYTATYAITSPNATNPSVTVSVTFTVAGPTIAVSAQSLTFASTPASPNPVSQTVAITNSGSTTMTGLDVGAVTYGVGQPTGWLSASSVTTSLSAGGVYNQTVSVTTGSLRAGTYTATYPITSANATNPVVTVSVSFTVAGPTVAVSPAGLTFISTSATPNPAGQTLAVTNSGSSTVTGLSVGSVTYTAGQPVGWLSVGGITTSLSAGSSYNQSVSVSVTSLPTGTYTATYPITSANSTNPSVTVNVTLAIGVSGPAIALSTSTVTFNATAGGASPAAQTVSVTNGGIGTLSGLAVGSVNYTAGQPTGWLAAVLSGASAPTTLTLTPTLGALTNGTYSASVPITSSAPGVTNSPRTISVNMIVGSQGTITLLVGSAATSATTIDATLTLPISFDFSQANGLSLGSVTSGVEWDPTRWTFVSFTAGSFGSVTTNTANTASGTLPLSVFEPEGTSTAFTAGTLVLRAKSITGTSQITATTSVAGTSTGASILGAMASRNHAACIGSGGGLWGDTNADGAVNIIDAQQIARSTVGLSVLNATALAARGDVNADGSVNIIDAQQIARFSVSLSTAIRTNTLSVGGCE